MAPGRRATPGARARGGLLSPTRCCWDNARRVHGASQTELLLHDRQPPNAYAKLRARRAHDLRLSRDAGGRHERMDAALVSFSATLGRPRRQRRSRRDAQASLGHIRSGAPPAGAGAWRHHRTSYSRSQCPAPAHRPWRRRVTHDPRSVSRSGRRARCGAGARGHGAHGRAHRAFGARSSAPARSTPSLLVLERDGNLTH